MGALETRFLTGPGMHPKRQALSVPRVRDMTCDMMATQRVIIMVPVFSLLSFHHQLYALPTRTVILPSVAVVLAFADPDPVRPSLILFAKVLQKILTLVFLVTVSTRAI